MKKLISVLLFVAIVSNNLFGQDTTITTVSYQVGDLNKNESNLSEGLRIYDMNKKQYQITKFTFKKDSIIIGDYFNSVYKVIDHEGNLQTEQGLENYFYCKDPEGKNCYIIIKEKTKSYNYPLIVVRYSDGAYFYYTK